MGESNYLSAFARVWNQPSLEDRIAATTVMIADAGWEAVRVEVTAAGANARVDVGCVPVREGGAGARRLLLHAVLPYLAADGVYVVPAQARAAVAPFVGEGADDCVIVPLGPSDESIGMIVAFGSADPLRVRALHGLAGVLAIAVNMDRRLRRAEADAERAAVLARVGESIRTSLDREEILQAVARDVRIAFGAARCAMYVRDERDPDIARMFTADDPGIMRAASPERLPVVGTLLQACFRHGEVVRMERATNDAELAQLAPFSAVAMLLVPFVVNGKIDAGISIQYAVEHHFDDRDIILMRSIAMHVGLALANSHLYERERSARRRAEDIERNVRALKETRSVDEILQLLLDMIAREYELSGSAWSVEHGRLTCRILSGYKAEEGPVRGDTANEVLATIEALAVSDVIPVAPHDRSAWLPVVGARGGFVLPLRLDARVLGMLAFVGAPRDPRGREDREAYMRTVAAHGALALANAHAFEAERRFAQDSAAISEAGRAILGYKEAGPLAEAMCRVAVDLSLAQRAALLVCRDGALRQTGSVGVGGASEPVILALNDMLVSDAFENGVAMQRVGPQEEQTLVVPLRAGIGAAPVGVFICTRSGRNPQPFDRAAIRLLESLGTLVALGLANVELYNALAENNEFKDDLLAMFTHDFKGPLTVIQGYTELLMEDDLGAANASIATIYQQSLRLAKLAEDALVLARTQAAGFSLQRTVCDLNFFVGESVDAHDLLANRITFTAPPQDTLVSIDRVRLKHVIDNVIANALKYSTGLVEVSVSTANDEALVRVSDRGIGIPLADRERIFARFGRATNARSLGIAGTGVGLYVSRKIVDVHGGRIGVSSRENEGSTFEIALPLSKVPVAADPALVP